MTEHILLADQEYLVFRLGREEFGVDILSVQEIRVWSSVTEVPNTPEYLKGVINLRGVIVPIIDLRQRFNHDVSDYDETTVFIVLQGEVRGKRVMIGLVVDEVSDVHKIESGNVKSAPDFGSQIDSRFIEGMAVMENKIIILLDYHKLLDVEEIFSQQEKNTEDIPI